MYKSKVLEGIIKDKPVVSYDKELTISQNVHYLKNSRRGSLSEAIAAAVVVSLFFSVFGAVMFFGEYSEIELYLRCIIAFLILAPFSFFVAVGIQKVEQVAFSNAISNIFKCLSDKPYEIRCEFVKLWGNKVKVIVEDNTYLDGGHVIKEKTRHFTSYLDSTAPNNTILAAIVSIVKKAEADFGVAEKAVAEIRRKTQ
jgi:hypothetical protein